MMSQSSHVHQHILAQQQHQHQHQQHYMLQQLPNAIPLAGKKAAGGGKGQGGRPPGVKHLSKQQAKQQVAQLHAHVHAAQQQHRMMMGHFPAGYMGYPPMAPHGGGVVYIYIYIYLSIDR